jgi:hypothetical protein
MSQHSVLIATVRYGQCTTAYTNAKHLRLLCFFACNIYTLITAAMGQDGTGGATIGGIDAATLSDAAGALDGATGVKRSANGAIKKGAAATRGRGKGKAAQQACKQ